MRPPTYIPLLLRSRSSLPARCFTSSARHRRKVHETSHFGIALYQSRSQTLFFSSQIIDHPTIKGFSTAAKYNAISFRDLKSDKSKGSSKSGADQGSDQAPPTQEEDPAERAYRASQREREAHSAKSEQKQRSEQKSNHGGENENSGTDQRERRKKDEAPPPPPYGQQSPWQVFRQTLQSEFKASKEWHENTQALLSSANQFTENESVKRARAAYTAASGAATSGTASAIKGAGRAVGQGAAWTWDSTLVKGVRSGVKTTASGIDKITVSN